MQSARRIQHGSLQVFELINSLNDWGALSQAQRKRQREEDTCSRTRVRAQASWATLSDPFIMKPTSLWRPVNLVGGSYTLKTHSPSLKEAPSLQPADLPTTECHS